MYSGYRRVTSGGSSGLVDTMIVELHLTQGAGVCGVGAVGL